MLRRGRRGLLKAAGASGIYCGGVWGRTGIGGRGTERRRGGGGSGRGVESGVRQRGASGVSGAVGEGIPGNRVGARGGIE